MTEFRLDFTLNRNPKSLVKIAPSLASAWALVVHRYSRINPALVLINATALRSWEITAVETTPLVAPPRYEESDPALLKVLEEIKQDYEEQEKIKADSSAVL